MKRTDIVMAIAVFMAAVGAYLMVQAGSLATNWQPLGDGAWGGTTDSALRNTYCSMGLATFSGGLVLLAMAAWAWMARERTGRI